MKRLSWFLVCALLVLCTATNPARAQDQQQTLYLDTLDADNTAVTAVLQILAAKSGLNIVTSPAVQGRMISIHLRNIPFDEALNLVVRAAGLGYERIGRSILVAEPTLLSTETGAVSRVFELRYARAAEAQALLQAIAQDVSADPYSNRIVIRGPQSTIDQAEAVINQLDRKPGQVLLEARLIEVDTSALLEVGIDWEKITKWSTVIAEGSQPASQQGQVPQSLSYVKFDETRDIHRQVAAFQIQLDALLTDGNARLLSHAKVVTLDNRPAEIFAGETVPVVVTSLQNPGAGGGVLQTVQLEKIDVGVKLAITPRISEDGMITVVAEPEVSRIVAFVGPNDDLPQTSTRRARSFVRVHDGETIFLGGLLADEKRTTVKKVPLLGSIPLLGYLFRHHREDVSKTDLVIEITPRIVGDQGAVLPQAPNPLEQEEMD